MKKPFKKAYFRGKTCLCKYHAKHFIFQQVKQNMKIQSFFAVFLTVDATTPQHQLLLLPCLHKFLLLCFLLDFGVQGKQPAPKVTESLRLKESSSVSMTGGRNWSSKKDPPDPFLQVLDRKIGSCPSSTKSSISSSSSSEMSSHEFSKSLHIESSLKGVRLWGDLEEKFS